MVTIHFFWQLIKKCCKTLVHIEWNHLLLLSHFCYSQYPILTVTDAHWSQLFQTAFVIGHQIGYGGVGGVTNARLTPWVWQQHAEFTQPVGPIKGANVARLGAFKETRGFESLWKLGNYSGRWRKASFGRLFRIGGISIRFRRERREGSNYEEESLHRSPQHYAVSQSTAFKGSLAWRQRPDWKLCQMCDRILICLIVFWNDGSQCLPSNICHNRTSSCPKARFFRRRPRLQGVLTLAPLTRQSSIWKVLARKLVAPAIAPRMATKHKVSTTSGQHFSSW